MLTTTTTTSTPPTHPSLSSNINNRPKHTNNSKPPTNTNSNKHTTNNPLRVQTRVNEGRVQGGRIIKPNQQSASQQVYTEGIKILYTNADQLRNKLEEMQDRIKINEPDLIAINEVKPKANAEYTLAEFNIDPTEKYEVMSNNIENHIGRGQLILVRKGLKHRQVYMNTKFSECLFVEINLKKKDKLLIALIYRSESEGEEMSDKLVQLVNETCNIGYTHLMITGDFNYKNINWDEMVSNDKIERKFLNCIMDNYLHQHVQEPTRWRGNDQPSLLDLILMNEENMVTNLDVQAPIGNSDHAVITFTYRCYAEENMEKYTKKKYHQANYTKMKEYLKTVSWKELDTASEIDETSAEFLKVYRYLEENHVPTVTKRVDVKDKMPLDKETLELVKIKTQKSRRVMRMKKRNSSDEEIAQAKQEYNRARNKV